MLSIIELRLQEVNQFPGGLSPHVFGSPPFLGEWNPAKAIPLVNKGQNAWETSFVFTMNRDESLEFQFVLKPCGVLHPYLPEEGPVRLLDSSSVTRNVSSPRSWSPCASFKMPGKSVEAHGGALLEFPVYLQCTPLSPFQVANTWKTVQSGEQWRKAQQQQSWEAVEELDSYHNSRSYVADATEEPRVRARRQPSSALPSTPRSLGAMANVVSIKDLVLLGKEAEEEEEQQSKQQLQASARSRLSSEGGGGGGDGAHTAHSPTHPQAPYPGSLYQPRQQPQQQAAAAVQAGSGGSDAPPPGWPTAAPAALPPSATSPFSSPRYTALSLSDPSRFSAAAAFTNLSLTSIVDDSPVASVCSSRSSSLGSGGSTSTSAAAAAAAAAAMDPTASHPPLLAPAPAHQYRSTATSARHTGEREGAEEEEEEEEEERCGGGGSVEGRGRRGSGGSSSGGSSTGLPAAAGAVAAAAMADLMMAAAAARQGGGSGGGAMAGKGVLKERRRLAIVMVGLPARGKSFTAAKLTRYLRWLGHDTKHFNVGKYRRVKLGGTQSSDFFRADNAAGREARDDVARAAFSDMLEWMEQEGGQVGIFDATNTTRARRDMLAAMADGKCKVIFVESMCTRADVIERNVTEKIMLSPDYANGRLDPSSALADFKARLANYEKVYEPVNEGSYIKLIDMVSGEGQMQVNNISGYLPGRIVFFLVNCHTTPRPILLTRHGESLDNVAGKIGGDPPISAKGEAYAVKLAEFIHKRLGQEERTASIWTSTLQRTVLTARHAHGFPKVQWRALDEINAGICDGMTYEEIKEKMPDEYRARKLDKLRYRYPRGESYLDVIQRLEPVIIELERQRSPVVVVAHQAILRALYAYFMDKPLREIPHIEMPLHTVIEINIGAGVQEKRFKLLSSSH